MQSATSHLQSMIFASSRGSWYGVLKDTITTKHMTSLVDKVIAKFNQNELCRYENLFNTAYAVSTHPYLKFKLKMVFVWAAVFRQGCLC